MTSAAPSRNARAVAARLLGVWMRRGVFPDRLLDDAGDDQAFVMEMVYGVVRWFRALDAVREGVAPRKPPPLLHALVLVGLYQVLRLDHVEPFAAVHETVEAAKEAGGRRAGNFVNAVLRRVAADPAGFRRALAAEPPAVRLSHPDVLVDRWTRAYGAPAAEALCAWDNDPPRVVLRVDVTRVALEDVRARLRERRVETTIHPARPDECLVLETGAPVHRLPGFEQGWFAVQDPSTLAAVDLLAPQPGERILDACAAPGGKTMAIAQRMRGTGLLLALDQDAARLRAVEENARRLGYAPWLRIAAADLAAGAPPLREATPGSFDGALLDVPCTNTGVLRRRPDARWRFTDERLRDAAAQQARILDAAAPYVRPGGRLVYSTCSLEPEENGDQVRAWLARHPDFRLDRETSLVPPGSRTDGAYAARLLRAGE